MSQKRRCRGLCLLGINRWRLRLKDTWVWFSENTWTAVMLAKTALRGIPRHTGGAKKRVLLHQSDVDIRHGIRRHHRLARNLRLERHLRHPVPSSAPNHCKPTICQPRMRIHLVLFSRLNLSILMHEPMRAYSLKILIQNCWLMTQHDVVSTLSAVSECCWHTFWRREQPIECTWRLKWALIEKKTIYSAL